MLPIASGEERQVTTVFGKVTDVGDLLSSNFDAVMMTET